MSGFLFQTQVAAIDKLLKDNKGIEALLKRAKTVITGRKSPKKTRSSTLQNQEEEKEVDTFMYSSGDEASGGTRKKKIKNKKRKTIKKR